MKKARVEQVLAKLHEPGVLISYNTEEKHPVECKVTSYACNDCTSEVIANRMANPFCPSCSGDLKQSSNKVMSFNQKDLKKLKPLVNCTACATSFITNAETHKALAGVGFNCPVCTSTIKANGPMNEDSDETSEDTSDDSDVTDVSTDDSDDSSNDTTSEDDTSSEDTSGEDNSSDEEETDSEIDEVMNNLSPDSDTPTDGTDNTETPPVETPTPTETPTETPAEDTADKPTTETPPESDGNTSTEDTSSDENTDEDEEKKEEAIKAAFFKAAIKNTKKFDLVHASNYNHWYLIGDGRTPIAVSAFDEASPEVQPVFRTDSYKNAFESGQQADGGINPDLLKDFGFAPVDVNVDLDDVTKQHIDDEVAKKTDELNNKIEEIEDVTAQCLGIAVMADLKGIYPVQSSIRTPLINKLSALKVRNADSVVDEILSKYMPEYMQSLVAKATELAHKSEAALAEQAELITSAEYRTPVTASTIDKPANVLPFAIHSGTEDVSNQENRNLNGREEVSASTKAPNPDLKSVIGSLRRPSNGRR